MPPKKRKPTHVDHSISINSRKKGKIQNNQINLSAKTNTLSSISEETVSPITHLSEIPPITHEVQNNVPKQNYYYQNKQKELNAWQHLREKIVKHMFENQAPIRKQCLLCKQSCETPVRCAECSSTYTACVNCAIKDHLVRPLHNLEIWTNGHFDQLPHEELPVINHPEHESCKSYLHNVTLIDSKGLMHDVLLRVCRCISPALLLIKLGFWPSSPTNPSVAFSLYFMSLMKALLLESQTSTRAFIESHRVLNNMAVLQGSKMYRNLVGAPVEEFRHACAMMQVQLTGKDEPRCPACPETSRVVSIDANFGLVRKQSSGKSLESPKHPSKFFLPVEDVQSVTQDCNESSSGIVQECNTFKAGDNVRSKQKNRKLDEKGVFGSVCRHEIPLLFINMPEGERLAYPTLLINTLLMSSDRLCITYDIACKLEAYLKRTDPKMLERLILAIPVFHCYGHKKACQIQYNPRRVRGFGLCDGEGIERLWAYLRKFSKITKEMTPVHRDSLLSEALSYHRDGKIESLGVYLSTRYSNAAVIRDLSDKQLLDLCAIHGVTCSPPQIESWIANETATVKGPEQAEPSTWSQTYVDTLNKIEKARLNLAAAEPNKKALKEKTLTNLEKKASKIEKSHNIERWTSESDEYKDAVAVLNIRNEDGILRDLLNLANERAFYCSLKRKYCDGQAVALRLSRQIDTVVNKIKLLLGTYNSTASTAIDFNDVVNPDAQCYSIYRNASDVPTAKVTTLLDLYFRNQAAQEEIELTSKEAQRLCDVTYDNIELLWGIECPADRYGEGLRALIYEKVVKMEKWYDTFGVLFNRMSVIIRPLPHRFTTSPQTVGEESVDQIISYVECEIDV